MMCIYFNLKVADFKTSVSLRYGSSKIGFLGVAGLQYKAEFMGGPGWLTSIEILDTSVKSFYKM